PPGNTGTARRVHLAGDAVIRTDAAGRFQTPRQFEPDGDYRVVVEAENFQGERSGWLTVGDARPLAFPDLTLQRLRVVQGRVLDPQGKPVAEARVSFAGERRRAAAATDAAGRFRLPDVADGPGFLFVEKTGFRFHGQPARAGGALEVVLVRRAEPSG